MHTSVMRDIDRIVEIENSVFFKLTDAIADSIDQYFKYVFPVAYLFYLGSMLAKQEGNIAYVVIIFILNFSLLFMYFGSLVRYRMKNDHMNCC